MAQLQTSIAGAPVAVAPGCVVRLAGARDVRTVRRLDDAAFRPGDPGGVRAAPGELEDGVDAGDVYLLDRAGDAVAYLQLDRTEPGRTYVCGLAVRPDVQGHGLGALLMDHLLAALRELRPVEPVVTVTSPRNLVMLTLVMSRGFAARWLLRDHVGPGRDRFGLQLTAPGGWPPGETVQVPATDLGTVYELIEHGFVARSLVRTVDGFRFGLARSEPVMFLPCGPPTW